MAKRTRVEIWLRWDNGAASWVARPQRPWFIVREYRKAAALTRARALCRMLVEKGALVQLKVCRKDGTIAFEHTYPRSSDPRRSKG